MNFEAWILAFSGLLQGLHTEGSMGAQATVLTRAPIPIQPELKSVDG